MTVKYALAFGYLGTIVGANWAITQFGIVPVGLGLAAPAGVYFAGLSFGLRDLLQESSGKRVTLAAIAIGTALSFLVAPPVLAGASGLAFLLSEIADFLVYTPLRKRGWVSAVIASNIAGSTVDSALFLWVAFGSLAFLSGQILGKVWMILPVLVLMWWAKKRRPVA